MACGQGGIIAIGEHRRPWRKIAEAFVTILRVNEHRGKFATGAAVLRFDGSRQVVKHPVPAHQFVEAPDFRLAISGLDNSVEVLMGHCRWPTGGSHLDNSNNHPIVTDLVCGTHNGWVTNADDIFEEFGWERRSDVDSEVIFRMADEALRQNNLGFYLENIHRCRGPITAVWHARPTGLVYVTRIGTPVKPLEGAYSNRLNLVIYSSVFLGQILESADLGDDWMPLEITPGTWQIDPNTGTIERLSD